MIFVKTDLRQVNCYMAFVETDLRQVKCYCLVDSNRASNRASLPGQPGIKIYPGGDKLKLAGQPGNTVAGQTAMPPFRGAKEIDPKLGMPRPQCTRAAGQPRVPGQPMR